MRTRQSMEQRAYLKEASDSNALGEVFQGLDIFGETCWTINRKVFDTVITVWNSGEAIADIPPQVSTMEYPVEPKIAAWDVKARMNWISECKRMSRMMQNAHSQRCDVNYKLEIARAVFRILFMVPDISSLGKNYISRIVLTSGVERILYLLISIISETIYVVDYYSSTKANRWVHEGYRWLKIHLANVYGLDKMKLEEREEFAMNSIDNIFDSADHPLDVFILNHVSNGRERDGGWMRTIHGNVWRHVLN